MKIKEEVLACGSFEIKYGKQTRFWEEHLGGPKAIQRSVSINLQHSSHALVVSALSSEPLNILFRRALVDKKHQEWLDLIVEITNINLVEGRDHFRWNLYKYEILNVRSNTSTR